MNKHIISLLLITLLIGSCAPAPTSPPPTTATATQTIPPSETPTPTSIPQTEIPTVTPYPPLQTDGPYLLFTDSHNSLTMMDADGAGRKHIELPNDGRLSWYFDKSISPDGKWLVYYTGTEEEPYDLALHLFNISNNTSQLISNLIASGYPDNLIPVTETMYLTEYDTECANDLDCRLSRVQSAFRQAINNGNALDWSPDSKMLAFAAQIDGPSSDIYIFNTEETSIRRLTNELENIWGIDWAPNGEKVIYESSVPGTIYLATYLHIVEPRVETLQNPKRVDGGLFWFEYGWIDQDSYLIYSGGEGAPPSHLRIINTENQTIKKIWEYSAESFFVDLEKQIVILSPYGRTYLQEEPEIGVYIVAFDGNHQKVSDELVFFLEEQDAVNQYIASDEQHQLIGINLDGLITHLSRRADYYAPPSSSPDGKWIIVSSETETELYSGELQLIKSLGIHAEKIIWRPDSAGVFLFEYPDLYYLPINNEKLIISNICSSEDCFLGDYVWLP